MNFLRFSIISLIVLFSSQLQAQLGPEIRDLNGEVRAIIEDENYIYFGGDFTHYCEGGGSNINLVNDAGLVHFNQLNQRKSICGDINTIVTLPDIGILIAGHFILQTEINDQLVVLRNIAFIRNDGTVDLAFNPLFNGPIHKMIVNDNGANFDVFVAGKYDQVRLVNNITTAHNLSRLTLSFNPDPNDRVLANVQVDEVLPLRDNFLWSNHRVFKDLLLDTEGGRSHLYVAGEFHLRDDQFNEEYENLMRIDLAVGQVQPNFRLAFTCDNCPDSMSDVFDTAVNSIALDGSTLYVAGSFRNISAFRIGIGNNNLNLISQNLFKITDVRNNDYQIFQMVTRAFNDTVHKILFHRDKLYVAGEFTRVTNNNLFENVATFAKLDTLNNGSLERFDQFPFTTRVNSSEHKAYGLVLDGDFIYVTGKFNDITRFGVGPNIFRIDISEGLGSLDEEWGTRYNQSIVPRDLSRVNNVFVVSTKPTKNRNTYFAVYDKAREDFIPSDFELNNPVNALEIYDSKVWVGGSFDHLYHKDLGQFFSREEGLFLLNQNDLSLDEDSIGDFSDPIAGVYSRNTVKAIVSDLARNQIYVGGRLNHPVEIGGRRTLEHGLYIFNGDQLGSPRQLINDIRPGAEIESILIQDGVIANNGQSVLILGGNFRVINNGVEEDNSRNLAIFEENRFSEPRNQNLAFVHDDNFKVYTLAQNPEETGLQLYLGGQFTQNVGGVAINNIAKINLAPNAANFAQEGQIDATFSFAFDQDETVYQILIDELLDIYIAGQFELRASHNLVVSDLESNLREHYQPNPNYPPLFEPFSKVTALAINDEQVHIGGLFTEVNRLKFDNVATVDKLLDRDNDTVLNDDDCNPNLQAESRIIFEYLDNDQDGFPNIQIPNNHIKCVGLNEEPVVDGFLWFEEEVRTFDCNDNDPDLVFSQNLLKDTDNDGYADSIDNADVVSSCLNAAREIPEGFIEASDANIDKGIDCDSNNGELFNAVLLLPDSDGDGFVDNFDPANTQAACLNADFDSPTGFVVDDNNRQLDNCVDVPNPNQEDADTDGVGDACDCDADPNICGEGFTCNEGICIDAAGVNPPNDGENSGGGGGGCSLSSQSQSWQILPFLFMLSLLLSFRLIKRQRDI